MSKSNKLSLFYFIITFTVFKPSYEKYSKGFLFIILIIIYYKYQYNLIIPLHFTMFNLTAFVWMVYCNYLFYFHV